MAITALLLGILMIGTMLRDVNFFFAWKENSNSMQAMAKSVASGKGHHGRVLGLEDVLMLVVTLE